MSLSNKSITPEQSDILETLVEAFSETQEGFSITRSDSHGIWILVGRAPGLPDDWDLWNPWIEDDHAFKLLIEFRVSLEFYKGEVMSFIRDGFTCQTLVVFRVLFEDYESPEEAVRAAIVETVHKYVLLDREQ